MSGVGKPGYKETAVGWIPVEWNVRSLEELSNDNITYGVVQPGPEVVDGVPLVRGGDVKDGRISNTLRTISYDVSKQFSRTVLRGGELLVSLVGYPGETAIASSKLEGANIARQVGLVRLNDKVLPHFVQQYLASPNGKKVLLGGMIGSAQQVVNLSALREVDVPIPPLPEQQKIAAILSAVDDKLDLIARQISATQTLKQGLMQTLFTHGAGTPDPQGRWHPHTEFQDTELGRIPVGWRVTTVNDLGELKNGINKAKEDFGHGGPFVNLMDVFGKTSIQSADFGLVATTEREREDFSLAAGDFLFIRSSVKPSGVGLAALVEAELPGAVYSGFLIRLRPRLEDVVSRFLMHFFASDAFRKCLLPKSTISANTNINQGALGSLPVAMPDINEQSYIADVLDQLDQKLATLTTQQTHYQSLKRGLMQKLLTGEWRVRVDAATLALVNEEAPA